MGRLQSLGVGVGQAWGGASHGQALPGHHVVAPAPTSQSSMDPPIPCKKLKPSPTPAHIINAGLSVVRGSGTRLCGVGSRNPVPQWGLKATGNTYITSQKAVLGRNQSGKEGRTNAGQKTRETTTRTIRGREGMGRG